MLGIGLRRHHPGDLRQLARLDVGGETVEKAAAFGDVRAGLGSVVKRAVWQGVLILREIEQRVVAVIADRRGVGVAPALRRGEAEADVLVDLPGDAASGQHLGEGTPTIALLRIVDHRAAAVAVVADPARPHVVAVGVGRAEQRAMVVVADGEGVGERIVERDVVTGQIGHRRGALGGHPAVVAPLVPGDVGGLPIVCQVLDECEAEVGLVRPERQRVPLRAAGLVEHRIAR